MNQPLKGTNAENLSSGSVGLSVATWDNFLFQAYQENKLHLENIEAGEYDVQWQSETPLFHFTRLVWSHPNLGADANRPTTIFSKIEATLKKWSTTSRRQGLKPPNGFTGDAWEEWFGVSREDAKAEFLDHWTKFRFPANQTPLQAAVTLARRNLLIPNDEVCERRMIERNNPTEGYCFFLSVCGHLQASLRNDPIFLPQNSLAQLLRVSGRTVSRWRQWAVEDGYLQQTAPSGRRKAAEYRFDISGWRMLRKKAFPKGED